MNKLQDKASIDCTPLFAGWTRLLALKDGTAISLRPLRADDRKREVAFLESLSQTTRYFRVMTPLRFLPPHMLDELMDIDGRQRMAFVAVVVDEAGEHIVGVARYVATDNAADVELGITVTDAWQHRGIASHLLQILVEYAGAHGVLRITGFVLPENHRMLQLARKMGFAVRFASDDRLMHMSKELAPIVQKQLH